MTKKINIYLTAIVKNRNSGDTLLFDRLLWIILPVASANKILRLMTLIEHTIKKSRCLSRLFVRDAVCSAGSRGATNAISTNENPTSPVEI
jgi:hypothetical protein